MDRSEILMMTLLLCLGIINVINAEKPVVPSVEEVVTSNQQLGRNRQERSTISISLAELRNMIQNEIEKYDNLKNKSPFDEFYSHVKKVYEKCEKYCPNGTDYILCGEECKVYYLNKTMTKLIQSLEIQATSFLAFKKEIQDEFANPNTEIEKRLHNVENILANRSTVIQELKEQHTKTKNNLDSESWKNIAIIFVFMVIIVIVFAFLYHKIKKDFEGQISYLKEQIKSKPSTKCTDDHELENGQMNNRQDTNNKRNTMYSETQTITEN
uniref:uncharacterized protein LOC120344430 n=1 Tax=Styela clava TaxID=7725 RepID=UPI001939E57D|nr:uncharacterized protein LOC120344430 [Styela clava]